MKLINKLIQRQKTEKLSDELFASKFGIHRMTWYRIKTCKTGISANFLRRVVLIYPDLKDDVSIFLSSNVVKATRVK